MPKYTKAPGEVVLCDGEVMFADDLVARLNELTRLQDKGNVMSLRNKQSEFAKILSRLLDQAHMLGYEVTLGDAYRDPRVFGGLNEHKGYGARRSAHKQRLAIDLNLFHDGKYLSGTEDHRPLGEWWESQGGIWGGRFDDGNHYQWPVD